MTTRTRILLVICITLLGAAVRPLHAQTKFGPQATFANSANFGIGARLVADLSTLVPARNLSVIGSFDYFFPGNSSAYWELNGNVAYRFTIAGAHILPYAGGGLDVAHGAFKAGISGGATKIGLNILAGTWFNPVGRVRPFVELRAELGGGEQFLITGGILF